MGRASATDVSPRALTIAAATGAALVTLLVSVLPVVHFAYREPAMHVALETTGALILVVSAYLVFGRLRRSGDWADLALVGALTLLALANLLFSAAPTAVGHGLSSFSVWTTVLGTAVAAVAFALAAVVRTGSLTRPGRDTFAVLGGCVAVVGMIAGSVAVLGPDVPQGIDPTLDPEGPGRPRFEAGTALLVAQLVAAACYGFAAWRFTRRAEQTGDALLRWLAAGLALSAFARFNYALFPSRFSEWIYTGDILRFGFHLALLTGAGLEIGAYQRGLARAAAMEERRRVARQLHDGLAQELAFIVFQARRLASKAGGDPMLFHLATAGENALAESRHAIAALSQPTDEPLDAALARVADEMAHRSGVALTLELAADVQVGFDAQEALQRILREAMTNAARHGQAQVITVSLSDGDGVRLCVADDGVGFDPGEAREPWRGLGLVSMRERAEALGGQLRIDSAPGQGTRIEVLLP